MNKIEILTDYLINPRTSILLPAKQIEQGQQFFVKKTALELIEDACSKFGATFDGRRKSGMEQTGFKRRVPIPISIRFKIYAFPLHSIKDHDCIWVFPNHIHHTMRIAPVKRDDKGKSLIVFINGLEFELDIPQRSLKRQLERTKDCKYVFTD